MKFCMVTTFFRAESFGGDAAYVDRLSRALLRHGHEVHVVHCVDAFKAVRGNHPLRPYTPPEGLIIHRLESPHGFLSPLVTQMTGQPWFKTHALHQILDAADVDVVHFHNISLAGGAGVLQFGKNAVKIMTAHEHWLICQMHLLWKYGQKPCDSRACIRCSLAGHRPPQLWRATGSIGRGLRQLDALLFPSQHTLNEHRSRGIEGNLLHVPYFLPDEWSGGIEDEEPEVSERPYLAAAGRLVAMKGFQNLIPLMRYLPEVDLRIAGAGEYESELRRLAEGLPNVHFEGLLAGSGLAKLFRGARAVVVPSLFPETFGYVVLEAFAVQTPVIVHRGGGALFETGVLSGGGLGYETEAELLLAMRRMVYDNTLRDELADQGYAIRIGDWSERAHLDRYFAVIDEARQRHSGTSGVPAPHLRPGTRVNINERSSRSSA